MRAIITVAKEVAPVMMHFIGEIALSWRAMLKGNRFEKLQIIFKLLINRFNLFLYELASKLYL